MEVDVKGRRRVSWDSNKGGVKNFKWVTRASKELGKGKLGLGFNKLAALIQNQIAVASDQVCNNQMGFTSNP